MFLVDLFWEMEGGWKVIVCAFWGESFLGDSNTEKLGDHQKKEFFINKSAEALIPLKEWYQGLLKLHVPLGDVPARRGGGWDYLQKVNFFQAEKKMI